jgi:hypothetical protein
MSEDTSHRDGCVGGARDVGLVATSVRDQFAVLDAIALSIRNGDTDCRCGLRVALQIAGSGDRGSVDTQLRYRTSPDLVKSQFFSCLGVLRGKHPRVRWAALPASVSAHGALRFPAIGQPGVANC